MVKFGDFYLPDVQNVDKVKTRMLVDRDIPQGDRFRVDQKSEAIDFIIRGLVLGANIETVRQQIEDLADGVYRSLNLEDGSTPRNAFAVNPRFTRSEEHDMWTYEISFAILGTQGGLLDLIFAAPDTYSLGSVDREVRNIYMGDAGGIYFGLAQDVYLHRKAADILGLATGDKFAADEVLFDATNRDARLYRSAANVLALATGDRLDLLTYEGFRIAPVYGANLQVPDGTQLYIAANARYSLSLAKWIFDGSDAQPTARLRISGSAGDLVFSTAPANVGGDPAFTNRLIIGNTGAMDFLSNLVSNLKLGNVMNANSQPMSSVSYIVGRGDADFYIMSYTDASALRYLVLQSQSTLNTWSPTTRMDFAGGAQGVAGIRVFENLKMQTVGGKFQGIQNPIKAGIPTDADFNDPQNGLLCLDSTNHRLYVRDGAAWKYAALT